MAYSDSSSLTLFQLAFAVLLNRSKPPNVSVRDYILALREHIYPGPRPQFSATYEESQKNYINAAFYFEALAKNAQKKNEELRNRIAKMERQYNVADEVSGQTAGPATEAMSRKPVANANADLSTMNENEGLDTMSECLQDAGICQRSLLRHLYNLETALQESPSKPRRISRLLGRVCTAFGVALEAMLPGPESSNETQEQNTIDPECSVRALSQILFQIFAGFTNLIKSSSKISEGEDVSANDETQNQVSIATYSILFLFRTITNCVTKSSNKIEHDDALGPKTPQSMILDSPRRLSRAFITHLLLYKSQAHVSKDPHLDKGYNDLLEGVLSILFTHAGALLYTSTFSTPRSETIAAEIAANLGAVAGGESAPPDSFAIANAIVGDILSNPAHKSDTRSGQRTATSESRSILSLLQLALPAYRNQFRHDTDPVASTAQEHEDIPRESPTPSLVAKPMDAVQSALIKGIFGSPPPDSPFGSLCLDVRDYGEMANSDRPDNGMHTHFDEDEDELEDGEDGREGDWFARQMWELVGWEVLARGFERSSEELADGAIDCTCTDDDEELI